MQERLGRPRALAVALLAAMVATLVVLAAPQAANAADGAIVTDDACNANVLAPNDDDSTDAIALPFDVNFFGVVYDTIYVNNNGNVTFVEEFGTFTPFELTADGDFPPIIAPFLADVETSQANGDEVPGQDPPVLNPVRYGSIEDAAAFGGHDVFCVNWRDVGYYSDNTDKLNDFQLLLVERNDRDPGDFDIYFNYERILWETGDASDGEGGFGGDSAGAGFASGNGNLFGFFELPCSRVNGGCLDSNLTTGLATTSTTPSGYVAVTGRHIFPVESGGETFTGRIDGTVTRASDSSPVEGAWVQVCRTASSGCRFLAQTNDLGQYTATQLAPGEYRVRVQPPGDLNPAERGVTLADAETKTEDFVLTGPVAPPAGTTLGDNAPGVRPIIIVGQPAELTTLPPCGPGGTVRYTVTSALTGAVHAGELTEEPPGSGEFTGDIIVPFTGPADVVISRDGCVGTIAFNVYIDPSGYVRDTLGAPIAGATVTLYYANNPAGPFVALPDGDTRMAPSNRTNPDTTDAAGHFAWDVSAGYYMVRAEKAGCVSPTNAAQAYNETVVYTIPPAVTDIDLRLSCGEAPAGGGGGGGGGAAPTTTTTTPQANEVLDRLAGRDRIGTAIALSKDAFDDGAAEAVVIAGAFSFADALVASPLAVAEDAPLLLVGDELADEVVAEIRRVLAPAGTVFLVGGTAVLDAAVVEELESLGYEVVRFAGVNRYETSVAVARDGLGDPGTLLLATGANFPDALAAGAAAALLDGAVLLSEGETLGEAARAYLHANGAASLIAVGGPAAKAAPEAEAIAGANRYETAAAVADALFDEIESFGVATGLDYPDALAGAAHIGRLGGPLLLVPGDEVPGLVRAYVAKQRSSIVRALVYGGVGAVGRNAESTLAGELDD